MTLLGHKAEQSKTSRCKCYAMFQTKILKLTAGFLGVSYPIDKRRCAHDQAY
jgi:hypothetical protein